MISRRISTIRRKRRSLIVLLRIATAWLLTGVSGEWWCSRQPSSGRLRNDHQLPHRTVTDTLSHENNLSWNDLTGLHRIACSRCLICFVYYSSLCLQGGTNSRGGCDFRKQDWWYIPMLSNYSDLRSCWQLLHQSSLKSITDWLIDWLTDW